MSIEKALENSMWKTNPENFLIMKADMTNTQGEYKTYYHVNVYSTENKHWVSCIIEDSEIAKKLALDMISYGVRVVTPEEGRAIIQWDKRNRTLDMTNPVDRLAGYQLDPDKVPAMFRHLIDLAQYWGVSDASKCYFLTKKTNSETLLEFARAIEPYYKQISDEWLEIAESEISLEYIAFSHLLSSFDLALIELLERKKQ